MTIGSICSGIEAASVAWINLGAEFLWFSEIAHFQSKFLATKYPEIPNLGDFTKIPSAIKDNLIECPDLICGGTPCQAFSLTGHKKGLEDERGKLTLKFIEVIDANDAKKGDSTIVFWENVEGVLRDKTNAFGCFVSALAGFEDVLQISKWPNSGLIRGPKRNVAWRVLDAKYFGVPQQRRRLYVIAGGKDFCPENILFERRGDKPLGCFKSYPLQFIKDGKKFEVFREYSDCLYSAYGTKWNGNAAAYNGSLFVAENDRLRRFTPLETERLMGFPDNYTDVPFAKNTLRYQGTGNSWAIPVVRWLGERLFNTDKLEKIGTYITNTIFNPYFVDKNGGEIYLFNDSIIDLGTAFSINVSAIPENVIDSNIADIIDTNASEQLFITPVGCQGILRRAEERGMKMNSSLQRIMRKIVSEMDYEEIEAISRIQPRGLFSKTIEKTKNKLKNADLIDKDDSTCLLFKY